MKEFVQQCHDVCLNMELTVGGYSCLELKLEIPQEKATMFNPKKYVRDPESNTASEMVMQCYWPGLVLVNHEGNSKTVVLKSIVLT